MANYCERAGMMKVALRKESVDRNSGVLGWLPVGLTVALRKESVDRNVLASLFCVEFSSSLSARRAWIEIEEPIEQETTPEGRSPQGERG